MLDDGDHKISSGEFVRGALRLRGQARSQDVIAVMHDCHKLMRRLEDIAEMLAPASPTERRLVAV